VRQVVAAAPVVAAVAVVVGVGVAYGVFTDRWGPSGHLERAVAALKQVKDAPPAAGDWEPAAAPAQKIDEETLTIGGIKEYLHHGYVNPKTGEQVSVLVVCGRGGPIAAHTPEVCYGSAGFRRGREPVPTGVEAGGHRHTFQVGQFAKPDAAQSKIEIFWAWSKDGGRTWDAPENPRLAYGRLPAVYKVYVVREVLPTSKTDTGDPGRAFLEAAIPALGDALAPAAADTR
jgi:hypothetical protein